MRLDGLGLFVEDMPKMIKFYRDVLGFEIKETEDAVNVYLIKDTTTFIRYLDDNHILRVSVLIGKEENKIKSVRYQSIKVKKKRELGRSA